jgi:coenzyme F420-reducing hydrogenase beta subunit
MRLELSQIFAYSFIICKFECFSKINTQSIPAEEQNKIYRGSRTEVMYLPAKEAGLAEKRINDSGVSSSILRAGKKNGAIDLALTVTPATSASPPTTTATSVVAGGRWRPT